jgi:hypothetical protein
MNMPSLAGEASLYRSTNLYRGYTGTTTLGPISDVVAADTACEAACAAADVALLVGCSFLGPFAPACYAAATAATVLCLSRCQGDGGDGSGGGGPPPRDCTTTGCRPGLVCCDCLSPAVCTTEAHCRQVLCRL